LRKITGAVITGAASLSCTFSAGTLAHDATIRWTRFGVPHVTAEDYASLGYGYGYVMAQDRLCLLADRIISLRGERSRAYGADGQAVIGFLPATNLNSDLFHRVQLSDASVEAAMGRLLDDTRDLSRGYAAGFNRYLRALKPQDRDALCPGAPLPEMRESDVVRAMMSIGTLWKAFHIGPFAESSVWGRAPAKSVAVSIQESALGPGIGSNAWAYGGDATRTGSSIVVANPHSRWRGHWLSLHQLHLTIPGELDVAGADFAGLPFPVVGFNADVAWSIEAPSTVSYFVLQLMKVEEGASARYTLDGESKPLALRPVAVEVKQADGSVRRESFPIAYSELGPLYRLPAMPGRPAGWYAVTDAGDGNAAGLDQFLAVARARDVAAFTRAVEDHRGLGAHLIAGDRHGSALYIESGPLLDVDDASLSACRVAGGAFNVLDGTRSSCSGRASTGEPKLLKAEKVPTLTTRGIVQNTNDSYRFSIHGRHVTGYSRLLGDPGSEPLDLRMPMSEKRMTEISADGAVTGDEAMSVVFDNRNYAAETWLDDILAPCAAEGGSSAAEVRRGCEILKAWDRRNEAWSRGALLFGEVWQRAQKVPGLYSSPFDIARPFAKREIATTGEVRTALLAAVADAVKSLAALKLTGAEPWGTLLAARGAETKVPLHGGPDGEGVLNALEGVGLGSDGYAAVGGGTDYLQLVRWESGKPVASVVLAHGQSDDPKSPHFSDQLALYSGKQLVRLPYTEAEIAADPQLRTLRLSD
jgi:acyl-homoserine-lactone acylase